jgi:hypothetical protein
MVVLSIYSGIFFYVNKWNVCVRTGDPEMTSCWLCAKVVNDISRKFFSLQSYVYSPQHNKGRNHRTYLKYSA